MKSILLSFGFLAGFTTLWGQQVRDLHCGTDEMHQRLFQEHPEYNTGIEHAHQRLQAFTQQYEKQAHAKTGQPYIIPVVFHIIHNYGPENIGDAQILDAVKQLNIQYRKLNADTTDIVNQFKSLAADAEIEFRLAQIDPQGNCTSGITRTVSPLTAIGDHQVKTLVHWPPEKYLNVYVCAEAAGLAGHSMMPAAADTVPEWDGIVIAHDYVGTIGTSQYFHRTVLSHEIGHFLNLQHIWGGNNVPGYYYLPCGDAGNCAFDDDVTDTPLTIGWQTCNLSGTSCGSLDNVQNYMDYAYCALMFTEGQKTRMHACLNSPVAHRNNLWSEANLIATGTNDGHFSLCQAKLEANKRIVCVGDTVILSDVSLHKVTSRNWNVSGGTLSSAQDSVVTWVFDQLGSYDVSLQVSYNNQNLSVSEQQFITVLPASGTMTDIHEPFEDANHVQTYWHVVPNDSPNNWERTTEAGFNSAASFKVENFDVSAVNTYEFISEPFDASQLPAIAVSFDWAYAQKQTTNIENMKLLYSTNCGETWTVKRNYAGSSSLKTVDTLVTVSFIPQDSLDWKHDVVSNFNPAILTNNLQFKIVFEAKGGNNLYVDNIRIADPAILGIEDLLLENCTLYPNPATDEVSIDLPYGNQVFSWSLRDAQGHQLAVPTTYNQNQLSFSISQLSSGVYFIQVNGSNSLKTFKLIKN